MEDDSELSFTSKKEQLELLEKVLKASDADADEEADFGSNPGSAQVCIIVSTDTYMYAHTPCKHTPFKHPPL